MNASEVYAVAWLDKRGLIDEDDELDPDELGLRLASELLKSDTAAADFAGFVMLERVSPSPALRAPFEPRRLATAGRGRKRSGRRGR